MDIARGEMVEGELDRLIERRSRQKDLDQESELWRESAKRYERSAGRWRATLRALIEHHQEQAAKLVEVKPKGDAA